MKLYELKHEEEFLIRAMRAFSFLELYGYTITGYKYNIFDVYPSITYSNIHLGISINISDTCYFFKEGKLINKSFSLSEIYKHFDSSLSEGKIYTPATISKFIQNFLMPIVIGKIWIKQLMEMNNKSINTNVILDKGEELSNIEIDLLNSIRAFYPRLKNNYNIKNIDTKDFFSSIIYADTFEKKYIKIKGKNNYTYQVEFFSKNKRIILSDNYELFDKSMRNGEIYSYKNISSFFDKYLNQVINGEKWIFDLIQLK